MLTGADGCLTFLWLSSCCSELCMTATGRSFGIVFQKGRLMGRWKWINFWPRR